MRMVEQTCPAPAAPLFPCGFHVFYSSWIIILIHVMRYMKKHNYKKLNFLMEYNIILVHVTWVHEKHG